MGAFTARARFKKSVMLRAWYFMERIMLLRNLVFVGLISTLVIVAPGCASESNNDTADSTSPDTGAPSFETDASGKGGPPMGPPGGMEEEGQNNPNPSEQVCCKLEAPDVKAIAWIDEFPCEGSEFDALVQSVFSVWCSKQTQADGTDGCDPTTLANQAFLTAIAGGLEGLCGSANTTDPPAQLSDPPTAFGDYIATKQLRGATRHYAMDMDCCDGKIVNEAGACTVFADHGYTPLPTGQMESGEGDSKCTKTGGEGDQCLTVEYSHTFHIGGPGKIIADILGFGFKSPTVFQDIKYELCCPAKGEENASYDITVSGSHFPSHKAYVDNALIGTHTQTGLGEFMYSDVDDAGGIVSLPDEVTIGTKTKDDLGCYEDAAGEGIEGRGEPPRE